MKASPLERQLDNAVVAVDAYLDCQPLGLADRHRIYSMFAEVLRVCADHHCDAFIFSCRLQELSDYLRRKQQQWEDQP